MASPRSRPRRTTRGISGWPGSRLVRIPYNSIYSKPGSLANHQTVIPRTFNAGIDGATVDLGDFEVQPGRTLAGRVIVSDGKALPRDAKVVVWPDNAGILTSGLDEAGRFEVKGIPEGGITVLVNFITGYRLSPRNRCLNPARPQLLEGRVDRDITDLTILIEPGLTPEHISVNPHELDPALVADFNDAKTGPITGVPPEK